MKNSQKSSSKMKIVPLGDRVLVKALVENESKTKSGIYIPETVQKEKPDMAEVIAVGDGWYQDGKLIPLKVKVGDKVLFSKYSYDEVKIDGQEYLILKQDTILAIIN